MKILSIHTLIAVLAITSASAEALYPDAVVKTLVNAIKSNDLKQTIRVIDFPAVAAFPQHAQKPEQVIELLGRLNLKDSKPADTYQFSNFLWPKEYVVRIRGKTNVDFHLRLVAATTENQEDHYVIIGIHSKKQNNSEMATPRKPSD